MEFREEDLRIEVHRPPVAGMNVGIDAVVRITHLPTGIRVTGSGERSQLQNKAKALRELEEKLRNLEQE